MSTLRANALEGVDAKNSITIVAGAGNITTTNVQEGLIKVWMQYNSDGNSIYDSFNTASVTDLATGNARNSFTNVMGNDDYCLQGACGYGYSMCFEDNEGKNQEIQTHLTLI